MTGKLNPAPVDLVKVDVKAVKDSTVEAAADEIWKIYEELGALDQIAKGPELRRVAIEALEKALKAAHQQSAEAKSGAIHNAQPSV